MDRKPDDAAIADVVDRLKRDPTFDAVQRGWIGNLYHVTDVRNAASILAMGRLLCHDEAQRTGVLRTAASAREIMDATRGWVHGCVRLYFRPRTPTFEANEGLRPAGSIWKGAHCPVPVAFVFDAAAVLGMAGVGWSAGNLAAHGAPVLGEDAASLAMLPFHLIYHHRAPRPDEDKDAIRHHRQAEVVVPRELGLDALQAVLVRSPADRQTLRTLLRDEQGDLDSLNRQLRKDHRAFVNEHTVVERVERLDGGRRMRIACTPPLRGNPRFAVTLRWRDVAAAEVREALAESLDPKESYWAAVPEAMRNVPVRLDVELDGALAFAGWFRPGSHEIIPPVR